MDQLLVDLSQRTDLKIEIESENTTFAAVKNYIKHLLINERGSFSLNFCILRFHPRKHLSNFFITFGIYKMEPKDGFVFCAFGMGTCICKIGTHV